MRTTLTLDPDVARLVEEETHRRRLPFKQVVNEAIRNGLAPRPHRGSKQHYRLPVHHSGLQPGVDPGSLNRLADEWEVEGFLDKRGKRR